MISEERHIFVRLTDRNGRSEIWVRMDLIVMVCDRSWGAEVYFADQRGGAVSVTEVYEPAAEVLQRMHNAAAGGSQ